MYSPRHLFVILGSDVSSPDRPPVCPRPRSSTISPKPFLSPGSASQYHRSCCLLSNSGLQGEASVAGATIVFFNASAEIHSCKFSSDLTCQLVPSLQRRKGPVSRLRRLRSTFFQFPRTSAE